MSTAVNFPLWALLASDILIACLAIYVGAELRFGFDLDLARREMGPITPRAVTFAFWIVVGLASVGMYRARQRPRNLDTLARTCVAVLIGGIAYVLFFYAFPTLNTGRGIMITAMLFCIACLTLSRTWLLKFFDTNPVRRKVLVLGAGKVASRIGFLKRRSDQRRFEVVGFVPSSDEERRYAEEAGFGPLLTSAEEALAENRVDEIVIALEERRGSFPSKLLLEQKFHGILVTDIINFLEKELEKIDLSVLHPGWLIYEVSSHSNPLTKTTKRLLDISVSLTLLFLTLPISLIIILAIKLEEGMSAPVLYRQERVGQNHRIFRLLKFRSMYEDAESEGARWASADDDRITKTGRLIRRIRFDELPQLINVLLGEMSLVGPRPERPEFVDQLSAVVPMYDYRHCVRPGITGWAQLSFPYGSSLQDGREKLKYDLYYIKNADIVFDLFVLLQTIEVVIWGKATSMSGPNDDELQSGADNTVRLFDDRDRDTG